MLRWLLHFVRAFLFDEDQFGRKWGPTLGRYFLGSLSIGALVAADNSRAIGEATAPWFGDLIWYACATLVGGAGASGSEALRSAIAAGRAGARAAPDKPTDGSVALRLLIVIAGAVVALVIAHSLGVL